MLETKRNLISGLLGTLAKGQDEFSNVVSLPLTRKGNSIRLVLVSKLVKPVLNAVEELGWDVEARHLSPDMTFVTVTPNVSTTLTEIIALGEAQAALDGSELLIITPTWNNPCEKYTCGFRLLNKKTPFDIGSLQLVVQEKEYLFEYEPVSNKVMTEHLETLYQQLKTLK